MKTLQHNNPTINTKNIFLNLTGVEIFMLKHICSFCSYVLNDDDNKRLYALKKME